VPANLPGAGGGEADEPMVLRSCRDRLKQQCATGLLGRNEFEDLYGELFVARLAHALTINRLLLLCFVFRTAFCQLGDRVR
jgi:hypothetical protein